MFQFFGKIFGVGLSKISPSVKEWILKHLTDLMDFLEKHFNNIVKSLFGIGGAGLGLALVTNFSNTIIDGATEKFGFFSRVLGIKTLFSNLSQTLQPFFTEHFNCTFIQAFAAFGCVDAINTIINSCAYALVFWLCVVVFKWVVGLLPLLVTKIATHI